MEYLKLNDLGGGDRDENCRAALLLRESARQELDESFILPDYLPDAQKILHVTALPLLRGRFLGNTREASAAGCFIFRRTKRSARRKRSCLFRGNLPGIAWTTAA